MLNVHSSSMHGSTKNSLHCGCHESSLYLLYKKYLSLYKSLNNIDHAIDKAQLASFLLHFAYKCCEKEFFYSP
jgi:hypothetical protein